MADEVRVPLSTGGLLRYYDEYRSKIVIKPQYIVLIIILTAILAIGLRAFAPIKG